jgi:hypothetical protein
MNIRYRTRITSLLAVMLCLILLFQAPVSAASELDFGTGSDSDETMSASELFDALFQGSETPLSDAEREALDTLSGIALTYNRNIPDRLIERDYDGSLGILTVRVKPYEYVAANGKTVSWIPTAVSLDGGEERALTASADGKLYTVSSLPIEAARVYREGDKVMHIKGTLCPVITSRRLEYHPCPICGKNNRAGTTKRCERCST